MNNVDNNYSNNYPSKSVNYADKSRLRSLVVVAVHSWKKTNDISQGEKRALSELKNNDQIKILNIAEYHEKKRRPYW